MVIMECVLMVATERSLIPQTYSFSITSKGLQKQRCENRGQMLRTITGM